MTKLIIAIPSKWLDFCNWSIKICFFN